MKITHPIIKLVVVIVVVGGALAYFYRGSFTCNPKSVIQDMVCKAQGGELGSQISTIGFSVMHKFGCFPKGKTSDAGKQCTSDFECQGYCLWLGGDIVTDFSHKTCSDYKKAIPVCAVK